MGFKLPSSKPVEDWDSDTLESWLHSWQVHTKDAARLAADNQSAVVVVTEEAKEFALMILKVNILCRPGAAFL
jgi:hypothetical protein